MSKTGRDNTDSTMASRKGKGNRLAESVPNKHLHSRISYLFQASHYLATQSGDQSSIQTTALSRRLLLQSRGISLKAQVRLSPTIKHSICKVCSTLLVPAQTSTTYVENKSRGGRKPWADVLVTECTVCGTVSRIPIGGSRQPKKTDPARLLRKETKKLALQPEAEQDDHLMRKLKPEREKYTLIQGCQ